MPRTNGIYTLPQAAFQANTVISSAAVNSDFSDIATQMTNSLAADGQTTMTGGIKAWGGGTALAPSYTFSGATTTGFFPSGGNIAVSIGGSAVAEFTSGGLSNTGGVPIGVPVGTVVDFAGATAPTGWYLCFGQSVSTSTFGLLFAAIGYTYGGGGANFNLPDCRGRATFGQDNMGGSAAGLITVAGGNFDGTILGNTGGQQNHLVLQTHLPALTLSTAIASGQGGHSHPVAINSGSGSPGAVGAQGVTASNTTFSTNSNTLPAMTGTTPTGGSGTAVPVLSNAIIFNKIIFAGA